MTGTTRDPAGTPRAARRAAARFTTVATAAVVALASTALLVFGSGTAYAGSGYRYWSFWERDGARWTYATQGPATLRPEDGDVLGFRFSVSENSADGAKPRGRAEFGAICSDTPAESGTKRVALLIDFGTDGDAPGGETPPAGRTECARVPEDASSAEALAAVAKPLRYDSAAILCAIAGYPERGCAEQVSGRGGEGKADGGSGDAKGNGEGRQVASDDPVEPGGQPWGLIGGIAAVVALGTAALWQARRRR
ncbi:SCO2322 family protein [Streptomyces sp. NPDC047108]|uniref:SCO2322 family protein n=1 Tax=Streptomyces sp. NPDC047108 TaxID=3155025 RepID=UPI0033D36832